MFAGARIAAHSVDGFIMETLVILSALFSAGCIALAVLAKAVSKNRKL